MTRELEIYNNLNENMKNWEKYTNLVNSFDDIVRKYLEKELYILIDKFNQLIEIDTLMGTEPPWSRNYGYSQPYNHTQPYNHQHNPDVGQLKYEYINKLLTKINIDIKDFVYKDEEINLEIVKEYYNILTGEKTLMLKTSNGLELYTPNMYKDILSKKIKDRLNDIILVYLDPSEEVNIVRKYKLRTILSK